MSEQTKKYVLYKGEPRAVKAKGGKNTRIFLGDGSDLLVPNEELSEITEDEIAPKSEEAPIEASDEEEEVELTDIMQDAAEEFEAPPEEEVHLEVKADPDAKLDIPPEEPPEPVHSKEAEEELARIMQDSEDFTEPEPPPNQETKQENIEERLAKEKGPLETSTVSSKVTSVTKKHPMNPRAISRKRAHLHYEQPPSEMRNVSPKGTIPCHPKKLKG